MTQDLSTKNFVEQVLKAEVPVLVDFWAPWCVPCQMMMPVVDKLAKESGGRFRVGKVNVDQSPEIAKHYGISGIPTLLLFHRGRMVKAFQGIQSERTLLTAVEKVSQPASASGSSLFTRLLELVKE